MKKRMTQSICDPVMDFISDFSLKADSTGAIYFKATINYWIAGQMIKLTETVVNIDSCGIQLNHSTLPGYFGRSNAAAINF